MSDASRPLHFCGICGFTEQPCIHAAPPPKPQAGDGWTEIKTWPCPHCSKPITPPNFVEAECGCRCCSESCANKHAKICGRDERNQDDYELNHRNG